MEKRTSETQTQPQQAETTENKPKITLEQVLSEVVQQNFDRVKKSLISFGLSNKGVAIGYVYTPESFIKNFGENIVPKEFLKDWKKVKKGIAAAALMEAIRIALFEFKPTKQNSLAAQTEEKISVPIPDSPEEIVIANAAEVDQPQPSPAAKAEEKNHPGELSPDPFEIEDTYDKLLEEYLQQIYEVRESDGLTAESFREKIIEPYEKALEEQVKAITVDDELYLIAAALGAEGMQDEEIAYVARVFKEEYKNKVQSGQPVAEWKEYLFENLVNYLDLLNTVDRPNKEFQNRVYNDFASLRKQHEPPKYREFSNKPRVIPEDEQWKYKPAYTYEQARANTIRQMGEQGQNEDQHLDEDIAADERTPQAPSMEMEPEPAPPVEAQPVLADTIPQQQEDQEIVEEEKPTPEIPAIEPAEVAEPEEASVPDAVPEEEALEEFDDLTEEQIAELEGNEHFQTIRAQARARFIEKYKGSTTPARKRLLERAADDNFELELPAIYSYMKQEGLL